jgi:hypothetical protein
MTYAELVQRLADYLAAEAKILKSQEYTVGQGGAARRNRRADLDQVQAGIATVQAQISAHPENPANRGARRIRYLRPAG